MVEYAQFSFGRTAMAEETKEKLLEVEEVRDRVKALEKSVAEMAEYVGIEDRRKRLAELEAQQAAPDFWNNQAKAARETLSGKVLPPRSYGAGI